MDDRVNQFNPSGRLRGVTTVLCFVTAFVNLIAISEYSNAWFAISAAYLLVAASQAFFAFLLFFTPWQYDATGERRVDLERDGRPYYIAGILICVTPVALYLALYTTGLGRIGRPDSLLAPTPASVIARLLEVVIIGCLVTLMRRTRDWQSES